MIDRESKFANQEIVSMLKTQFVPVAIDQWYTRKQNDAEGKFYQAIAQQGPRKDMSKTTQGHYLCDASGNFLGYNNNRHEQPLVELMKKVVKNFEGDGNSQPLKGKIDPKFDRSLPKNASIVRVNTKILGGYPKTKNRYERIFQQSIARDNLWILKAEKDKLRKGVVPKSLSQRIARFHLIDNTRGEPLMWTRKQINSVDMKLNGKNLTGFANIQSDRASYKVKLRGFVEFDGDKLKRFDVVASGLYSGDGPYTKNPPPGKFPLAIAFRLADGSDAADEVAPQGTKGWLEGYLGQE